MKTEEIVRIATDIAENSIVGTMLELVDVEYVRENNNWYLRIFVDQPGGMQIDDCQMLSEKIGAALDDIKDLNRSYFLEISSPGLDRKIKKAADFVRFAGQKIDISLYKGIDGTKYINGELVGLSSDENSLLYLDSDGAEKILDRKNISQVRLAVEF